MEVITFAAKIAMRVSAGIKVDFTDKAICDLYHSSIRRIDPIELRLYFRENPCFQEII
jgi:hypothetical protein